MQQAIEQMETELSQAKVTITELRSTMSENNKFYGDQMRKLNVKNIELDEQVMSLNAENAELKIKLRMKEVS